MGPKRAAHSQTPQVEGETKLRREKEPAEVITCSSAEVVLVLVLVLFFYFPRPVSWCSSVAQTDPEFAIYLLQPPDCAPPDFVCVCGGV